MMNLIKTIIAALFGGGDPAIETHNVRPNGNDGFPPG